MSPDLVFSTPLGSLHRGDSLDWMASLPDACARLVIADPPYNLRKAAWDKFPSQARYVTWTKQWVGQAHRLLSADGSLYLCGFPEAITEIAAAVGPMFTSFRCLVWFYRNKANVSADWGRSHESLLHLRKGRQMIFNIDPVRIPYNRHTLRYPVHPQAVTSQFAGGRAASPASSGWLPHRGGARPRDVIEVPTLCNGSPEKTAHPTQKPEELIRMLVLASSDRGDLVIDPFGGAGTTYAVCESTGRRWLGCEKQMAYCRIIARRLGAPGRFRAKQAAEPAVKRAQRRTALRGPA